MTHRQDPRRVRSAFTLIEMMVVVAIIGLLLAVLLPAFGLVRERARVAQTTSMFKAIDAGIFSYQSETGLGGSLPPSTGDNTAPQERNQIANPRRETTGSANNNGAAQIRIAGAHLLVHAMIGADGLGTPGFRDLNRDPLALWSDDTHNGTGGLYELDTATAQPKQVRYGGAGYVDDNMRQRMRSFRQLSDAGVLINFASMAAPVAADEQMFVDPWNHPILYYRANRAAVRVINTTDGQPGVFRQEDNGIITGTDEGPLATPGLDFGPGQFNGRFHNLSINQPVPQPIDRVEDILDNAQYESSFVRFVLDTKVKARPTPVRSDSYLLISAGPDGRYGTEDDIVNWDRDAQNP